jgi:hypothetical protein
MKGMLKLFLMGAMYGAGCAAGYFGILFGPAKVKELKEKAEDKLRKKFAEKEKDELEREPEKIES